MQVTPGCNMTDTWRGFRGRIDVIPLPIDTEYFSPGDQQYSRSLLNLNRRDFYILYVGSVSATKGDLVPFLAALTEPGIKSWAGMIRWLIAGPSDARYVQYLKHQLRLLGLTDQVKFFDYVTESEKLHLYRSADVFFSPGDSLQESFGLTPVEAMSCGVPQIVSDWNGYRETVVSGTTGFRIKTRWAPCDSEFRASGFCLGSDHDHIALGQSVAIDIGEWVEAIRQLVSSPQLRTDMGENSRRIAVSRYSFGVVAGQHCALWTELMTQYNGASLTQMNESDEDPLFKTRYFKCFGHYATEILNNRVMLRPAGRDLRASTDYIAIAAAFVNRDSFLIDPELCKIIVCKLSSDGSRLSDICPQPFNIPSNGRRLRHVMWLLKHGFIEIAS
jgi:hypothetical protein